MLFALVLFTAGRLVGGTIAYFTDSATVPANSITAATLFAPTGLAVTNYSASPNVAANNINLSWTSPGSWAASYNVYRSKNAAAFTSYATSSTTTFSDTGLCPADYSYRLRAVSTTGFESPIDSTSASATVTASCVAAPTGLTATAVISPTAQINLSWNATAGSDYYEVYRSTVSCPTTKDCYPATPLQSPTTNSASDATAASGTTYYYVVKSHHPTDGFSSFSSEASATLDSAAPSVSSVTPADGVENISVNATVVITFSEKMNRDADGVAPYDAGSVEYTFSLIGGANGTAYATTFAVSGTNAVNIGDGLSIAFAVGGTTTTVGDTYSFTATASPPGAGAITPSDSTSEAATVSGTYSGIVDKNFVVKVASISAADNSSTQVITTIRVATDSLSCSTSGASCSWSADEKSFTFDKSAAGTNNLLPSTIYTVRVDSAAQDRAGNTLSDTCASAPTADFCSSFTTKASVTPDTTAPTITSRAPAGGGANVPTNTNINVTFSEAMDTGATQPTFCLYTAAGTCAGNSVAGSFSWANVNSSLTYDVSGLLSSTVYRERITGGTGNAADVSSNPFNMSDRTSEPITLSGAFTGSTDQEHVIKVVTVSGTDDATTQVITGIQVSTDGGSTFGSTITVSGTSATSIGSGLSVAFAAGGTTTDANDTYSFTAEAPFAFNASSEPITLSGTYSGASNKDYVVKVATVSGADNASTQVITEIQVSTDGGVTYGAGIPVIVATAVGIGDGLSVAFAVSGTATVLNDTYWFRAMTNGGLITSWKFTTAAGLGPSVTLTNPSDGQALVDLNENITLTFSQAMNTASVQNAFCLFLDQPAGSGTCGANSLPGAFSWNAGNTTVIFNPTTNMVASSQHRVTLGASATNSVSVPLATTLDFAFVTGTNSPARDVFGPGTAMPGGYATFVGTSFANSVRRVDLHWDSSTGTVIGTTGSTTIPPTTPYTCSATTGTLVNWVVTAQIPFDATAGAHEVWAVGLRRTACDTVTNTTTGSVTILHPDALAITSTEYAVSPGDLGSQTITNPKVTNSDTTSEPITVTGTFTGSSDTTFVVKVDTILGVDDSGTQVITNIKVSSDGGTTYGAQIPVSGTSSVSIGSGISVAFAVSGSTTTVGDTYTFTYSFTSRATDKRLNPSSGSCTASSCPDGQKADITVTVKKDNAAIGTGNNGALGQSDQTAEPATLTGTNTATTAKPYVIKVATGFGSDTNAVQNITDIQVSTDGGRTFGSNISTGASPRTSPVSIGDGMFVTFAAGGTTTTVGDIYFPTNTAGLVYSIAKTLPSGGTCGLTDAQLLTSTGSNSAPLVTLIGSPNLGTVSTTLTACSNIFVDEIATGRSGNGLSTTARFTDPPAPPPDDFTLSPGSIQIGWRPSPDKTAAGYRVYLGTSPGVYDRDFDAGPATFYRITDVQTGTYYVVLRTYNVKGDLGNPTIQKMITLLPPTATTGPCFTPTAASTAVATSITSSVTTTVMPLTSPTPTPPVCTPTGTSTATPTASPTTTVGTVTPTPVSSLTPAPSATRTGDPATPASPTFTPVPATETATPTPTPPATDTPVPTSTALPTATTTLPPTATAAPPDIPTPARTDTPTATGTPTPLPTSTPTWTPTALPPSATPTRTSAPPPTATPR